MLTGPANEPIYSYAPGSSERASLKVRLNAMLREHEEIPLLIGGRAVFTGRTAPCVCPHDHQHRLAVYHQAGPEEVKRAIAAAREAWHSWSELDSGARAAVFLRAAELLSGPWRDTLNAATILNQSKTVTQAEIDAACELIDFWRFNVHYMREIHEHQPFSPKGTRNTLEYRPLEGFVLAVTPFNFTAIAGNLPTAPALMGNVVVWKPSPYAVVSGYNVMRLLQAAGLPDGVINFVPGPVHDVVPHALASSELAGVHFTGSTAAFREIWASTGQNVARYRSYPRLVGETGGKDFVFAHRTAEVPALVTALIRGTFEYQGQKCSAASRAYIPRSLWPEVSRGLLEQAGQMTLGSPTDFRHFMAAVISEPSFDRISAAVEFATRPGEGELVFGGQADKSHGYFVPPTVIRASSPQSRLMQEEIFGPVLTVYVYDDDRLDEMAATCNATSPYGLTGAVFAQDRSAVLHLSRAFRHAAGNFYINDKPTGAVVGQQPFGGSRASGTNDKAGSMLNLLRWTSPRAIKETYLAATHFAYPVMAEE